MEELINLIHDDGNPRVVVTMRGPSFCVFRLFLQPPNSSGWRLILEADNRNDAQQEIKLDPNRPAPVIDPTFVVGDGVEDFQGWKFGWFITFFGFNNIDDEPYDVTIEVFQNSGAVMLPPFQKKGTFNGPTKSFNGQRKFVVA